MASQFSSPFSGKPFTSGVPGTNSNGLSKLDAVKLPHAPSSATGRLAHAIARLPSVPSSRGAARDLFLP